MSKFIKHISYASLTGLLLSFAWPVDGFYFLIFFAWIPLLWLESELSKQGKVQLSFLRFSFLSMLIWNVLTTWWIKNASFGGALMAIIANSILMALVLYFFHVVKTKKGQKQGYFALIVFWMSFEYVHLRWDITWPWLNLGNAFANQIELIQWYEYTGVFGGTLWVLLINILLFQILKNKLENNPTKSLAVKAGLLLVIPICISLLIFKTYHENLNPIQVVVVQPNIDPYNEKFSGLSSRQQLEKLIQLTQGKLDQNTDFLVGPETALVAYIWENKWDESSDLKVLDSLLTVYKNLNILIGASTLKVFELNEPLSSTARKFGNADQYYDSYNTALQLDHTGNIQTYHKSKLVPGVEKMPWPGVFKYIEKFAIDLGGISGSLGMQEEREAFYTPNKKFAAGPIVCYESVYGEYVGEYVKKGANFLAIITNDGWWGDTPGYKQHLKYGAIRAIETRRSIVRSANTGISGIVNQLGEVSNTTSWWKADALKATINANNNITFYTRFGDYLGLIAIYTSLVIIVGLLFSKFKPR
ncbi:MAG TPA: apolipoprotein N-acyltransferase [Bacteroidia bacterium]|nr:apolipoprotein N-acyltransferase [Bacteroidia bacterium]